MIAGEFQSLFFWILLIHIPSVIICWRVLAKKRMGIDTMIAAAIYGPFALLAVWFLNDPRRCPVCKAQLQSPASPMVATCPNCSAQVAWVTMSACQRHCLHCHKWISRPTTYGANGIIVCPHCTKILGKDRQIMAALHAAFGDRITVTTLEQEEQLSRIASELNVSTQDVVDQVRRYMDSGHVGTQHRPRKWWG
mgnify:CR=1 FL=1